MKRIVLIAIYAALLQLPVSCLMQQEDVFDKTPAERTEEFISECREVLTSAENMWMIEYYPASDKRYGGYTYFLKFDEDEVTAWFQLAEDVTESIKSLYKITPDDGVTLSYDTYNEYLHYFAEPSSFDYQGFLGDYEFRVLGMSEDGKEVYLRGRKSGNEFTLRQFEGNAQEYLSGSVAIMETFGASPGFELTLANSQGAACRISYNTVMMGYIDLRGEYKEITIPFCFTDEGVRFAHQVEIGGVPYSGLRWETSTSSLVSDDGAVKLSSVWIPMIDRTFDAEDIIGFENDSEGYFGEYNYYARDLFDEDAQRRLISKVTFADSPLPDSQPDDNGISDEYMVVTGMFPSISDAKITFSVYGGIIYTIENDLGLVTRPSGNQYYIRMIHGSSLTEGFYPGYDYLMVGGYVDEGAIALVCEPNYTSAGINELYLSCYEKEEDMDDFDKSVGGAEWHADMLFIRPENDDNAQSGVQTPSESSRTLMSGRLSSIMKMAVRGPRNCVETPDGYMKSIIDSCRR